MCLSQIVFGNFGDFHQNKNLMIEEVNYSKELKFFVRLSLEDVIMVQWRCTNQEKNNSNWSWLRNNI